MNHSVCKKHSPACLHWQRSNVLEPTRRRLYRGRHRIGLSVLNLITSLSSCTQLDSAQSCTIGMQAEKSTQLTKYEGSQDFGMR